MEHIYFFDSYAIIEILKTNKSYEKYVDTIVVTTKMNLFEVYHSLLKTLNKEKADNFLENQNYFIVDFDEKDIQESAEFKLEHARKHLSMVDCTGYVLAKKLGIKFLTGEKEFKDFGNVEFAK